MLPMFQLDALVLFMRRTGASSHNVGKIGFLPNEVKNLSLFLDTSYVAQWYRTLASLTIRANDSCIFAMVSTAAINNTPTPMIAVKKVSLIASAMNIVQ